jgi:hypothetical protein
MPTFLGDVGEHRGAVAHASIDDHAGHLLLERPPYVRFNGALLVEPLRETSMSISRSLRLLGDSAGLTRCASAAGFAVNPEPGASGSYLG